MKIEDIIEEKNLKRTPARAELLEIFYTQNKPIAYEDIKALIRMDKATFYRNVSKFEQENILNSFESNDKKRYYEIQKNPHAHFICNECNTIECLQDLEMPKLKGYQIQDAIFKGLCKACNH
ncbi:MAG: transcriptional repressor [Epsilonproteobacteria bacterium]|nr:transcriptional repressor [Campylobacterota bacterium]